MKLTARGISVESGLIMISDWSFYQKYGFRERAMSWYNEDYVLKMGIYRVKYEILHTCLIRNPKGYFTLNLMSGHLVISDPCYIAEKWGRFGDDTNDWQDSLPNMRLINTGGDGCFVVKLDLKEIKPSKR